MLIYLMISPFLLCALQQKKAPNTHKNERDGKTPSQQFSNSILLASALR